MKHKFQYYRFFLSPINGNFLSQLANAREDALNKVFKENFECYIRGVKYSLTKIFKFDQYVKFKLAKHTWIEINKSPQENFQKDTVDHWPNINIYINMASKNNNDYGQIIAVEYKPSIINDPLTLLNKWADETNEQIAQYGYNLAINSIATEDSFWSIIKKYKGQIEEVVLEYSIPNLFNLGTELESELKETNKAFNAAKASIVISNKQGNLEIPEDNKLMQESADYIDKGGGQYKIKIKGEKTHRISAKKVKTKNIEIENLDIDCNDQVELITLIKAIFGD